MNVLQNKLDSFFLIVEIPQPLDDDEYEPFYPSEKLQIPYGMDIVCTFI